MRAFCNAPHNMAHGTSCQLTPRSSSQLIIQKTSQIIQVCLRSPIVTSDQEHSHTYNVIHPQ